MLANKIRNRLELYIRYVVVGFFTTLVSFTTFGLLHYLISLNVDTANTLSVITAVIFAYFANKHLVFKTPYRSVVLFFREILSFFISRTTTMLMEIIGVHFIYSYVISNAAIAKITVSFVVLILNYLFSQYFVFIRKDDDDN